MSNQETTPKDSNTAKPAMNSEYKIPAPHIQQMIRKTGTPEQIDMLDAALQEREQAGIADQPYKGNVDPKEYAKQLFENPVKDMASLVDQSVAFIRNKIKHKRTKKPEGITWSTCRSIYWRAYRELVKEETGMTLDPEVVRQDTSLSTAMANFVNWIIGNEEGEWDPAKSVMIYGNLGVGKSTLAMAAHITTAFFKAKAGWDEGYIDHISMDRLFLELTTTQDIRNFHKLATGSWVLDEVKREHATYKHYGNELPLLNLVISARHDLWKQQGTRTIITSNIPPSDLSALITTTKEERLRIKDRLKQEYSTYLLAGDNKRHPKERLKHK